MTDFFTSLDRALDRAINQIDEGEPVAYDSFGAPLYAHQIPSEGTE